MLRQGKHIGFREVTLTAYWKSKAQNAREERKRFPEKAKSQFSFPWISKEERPSIACGGPIVDCVRKQDIQNEEEINLNS